MGVGVPARRAGDGLLLVAGPLLLPEYRAPVTERLDLVSVGLSIVAALAVIYGLKELAAGGPGVAALSALLSGLLLALLFVRRQRTVPGPLLDLRLFAERRFSGSLGTLMLVILTGPGIGLLAAQYMQLVLGLSPLEAGLWSLPPTLAVIAGFVFAPMLARRFQPGRVAATGLVLSAAGILLLTALSAAGPGAGLGLLVAGQFVFFLGAAPMLVLGTDLVIGSAPPERSGSAAALSETAQEFGGAVGLAVFGSIAAAVYRSVLAVPEGVPAQAAEVARDTLGGAVAVASSQPAEAADALLAAARAAFTDGLAITAAVSAVVLLAAAALAVATLRHVPPSPSEEPPVREPAHAAE